MNDHSSVVRDPPQAFVDRAHMPYDLDEGLGTRVRIGLAALAGNQVTEHEFRRSLDIDGVEFYTSRLADSVTINPETLRETEQHLANAVSLILPGLPLDVVARGDDETAAQRNLEQAVAMLTTLVQGLGRQLTG